MNTNERAPAFILAGFFVIGIVLGLVFSPSIPVLLGIAAIFVGTAFLGYIKNYHALFMIAVAVGTVVIGMFRYEVHTEWMPDNHVMNIPHSKQYFVTGTIASLPEQSGNKYKFEMEAEKYAPVEDSLDTKAIVGKVLVYYFGDQEIDYGDRIRIKSDLPAPQSARNFFTFDYKEYLYRMGIFRTAFVYEEDFVRYESDEGDPIFKYLIFPIRRHIEYVIRETLKGDVGGFLEGIVLGGGKQLSRETNEHFVNVGVVHVLAVSGLHVGIIAMLFYLLFKTIFHMDRRWSTISVMVVLLIYMMITKMRPSVMRASLMVSIVMSGQVFGRKPRLLNSIGIAALTLLMINPMRFFDVGFQLSFGATFGIVYLYPRLVDMLPQKLTKSKNIFSSLVVQAGLVSICAQLGTFPILTYHFHRFAILSVFANIVVVPTIAFALSLGFLSIFTGIFSMWLANIFSAANWIILTLVIKFVSKFSEIKYASISFPHLGIWFIGLFFAILLFGVNAKRSRRSLYIFLILLVLSPTGYFVYKKFAEKPEMWILFMDVGQGDCVYIKYPNGRTMLIDGGFGKNYEYVIKPFVRAQGKTGVDEMLMTHAHMDHFAAMLPFVNEFDVERFAANFSVSSAVTYNQLLQSVSERVEYSDTIRTGDTLINIAPVRGRYLWPDTTVIGDDCVLSTTINNSSTVLQLQYGDVKILLPGDAEEEVEEHLAEVYGDELRSHIYKAAHHGSKTSNSGKYMQHIRPEITVVSVGDKNKFRHPSPQTIARFDSLGTVTLRTDKVGAVWIKTDGKRIWGESKLGESFDFIVDDKNVLLTNNL